MRGKKATEVKELGCGDIGAIGKMEKVKTGDTLCDARKVVALKELPFAEPCYSVAIVPKTRGQEDKIAQGLARMNEEDPTFSVTNNAETHQMVLNGSGDMQVDVLVSKLKSRFNVEADLKPVRVPYREKIRKTVQKQGRHKKQTGGSGQFRGAAGLQGRPAGGQPGPAGAGGRAEGHCARQLHGRRHRRSEQAPGPRHGHGSHRRRQPGDLCGGAHG